MSRQIDFTQIAQSLQQVSEKGQANGYAELDASGQIPSAQVPTIIGGSTTFDDVLVNNTFGVGVAPSSNWRTDWSIAQIGGYGDISCEKVTDGSGPLNISSNLYHDGVTWKFISADQAAYLNIQDGQFSFFNTSTTGTPNGVASLTEKVKISDTGLVGIGFSSPAYMLDVNGSIRSATGMFLANNPANTAASVSLSWLNNIARLRVGGSGDGASNGFQIEGTGDSLKWKVDGSGNSTSIGTTTSTRFISTVSTGTAPLSVSSTTMVTNLNAATLNGVVRGGYNTFNENVVTRHPSGYIYSNYFNMTAADTTVIPTRIAIETSSDKYLRWQTPATFRTNVIQSYYLRSTVDNNLTAKIIVPTANRDDGIFGTYDSTKRQHIWSMGSAFTCAADGSSYGNLYGLAYRYNDAAGSHGQYCVINGAITAGWGTNVWTSGQFKTTKATGTAPLVVSSTTTVTNLSADLLDGVHGSGYARNNTRTDGYVWIRRSTATGSAPLYVTQQSTGEIQRWYQGTGDGVIKSYIANNGKGYAPDWIATSDRRLKENIKSVGFCLEKSLKIADIVKEYDRIDTKEHEIGFIAQELNEIAPEFVSNQNTDKYWGVSYPKMVTLLFKSIKEQQDIITKQKNDMKILTNRLDKLEQLINNKNN